MAIIRMREIGTGNIIYRPESHLTIFPNQVKPLPSEKEGEPVEEPNTELTDAPGDPGTPIENPAEPATAKQKGK